MQEVQPIKDKKKILAMASYLRTKNEKYYIMFKLGIHTGLRISDILKLTVLDIEKEESRKIKEKKTGKKRILLLDDKQTWAEIENYIKSEKLESNDYLINSRKHDENGNKQPITRVQAYRVLNEAAEACGVDAIGTHSLRKTFGYWHYKEFHDIAFLQNIFNHSAPSVTLRYIGYDREEMEERMKGFRII